VPENEAADQAAGASSHRKRRVIGRVLSLGFPLPGVRVDNYNFCSAPAFFDYDALVVDQSSVSRLIEDVIDGSAAAATFGGRRVLNKPERPDDVPLAELLLRRRNETRQLLANRGVVVCFAHPPATHHGIAGMDEFRDDQWLGDAAPQVAPAEGTHADVSDDGHPFAPFVREQITNISYRAEIMDAVRPFALSYGGAVIGAEIATPEGRAALLPALRALPPGDARYAMSDTLQRGIRRMLGTIAEGIPPPWMRDYSLAARDDDAQKYQRLLWQEGVDGLDAPVLDALRAIGCDVYANDPNALELRVDGTRVLLEIEGSDGPIDLTPHYRLRERIEREIMRSGAAPRAAMIINGRRHDPPRAREQQASPALCAAAALMRYGLIPTTVLFNAVAAKLAGDDAPAAALRKALTRSIDLFDDQANLQQER
jgi:hypothetical protein